MQALAENPSGEDPEDVGQAVVNSHADEDNARDSSSPALESYELVIGLSHALCAHGDEHGENQNRQARGQPVSGGDDESRLVLQGYGY